MDCPWVHCHWLCRFKSSVNLRCTELLRQLEPHSVKARLETLLAAAIEGYNNQGSERPMYSSAARFTA